MRHIMLRHLPAVELADELYAPGPNPGETREEHRARRAAARDIAREA